MNPNQGAGPATGAVQALSQRPLYYCAMTVDAWPVRRAPNRTADLSPYPDLVVIYLG